VQNNTSYPLAFVGLKNSALALLNHKAPSVASSEAKKNAVTALLLAVITVCDAPFNCFPGLPITFES